MSQPTTVDAPEKSDDVISLQKQIADLLRKNQSLEQENEKLSKRFGLVWPEQPEFFVQVISDTEVVYQNGLYRRVGALETNGSKARLDFDGSDESEDLKRGDSPYLYTGKQSNKIYLGNGGIAYEWRKFINEDYLPTLVKKGSRFGFDDKNDQRKNLLIEGDNYHALQVLQHTHRGAIDVIYIDPPYNTGNGDFKYNDRFVSDEDGNRHSSWLSFMKKRMQIARSLLSSDGVVFISIDDTEQHHLTSLCDSVFGEKNRAGIIHWRKNRKPHNASKTIASSMEYLLVYYNEKKVKLCREFENDKTDENGSFNVYPIFKSDKKVRTYTLPPGVLVEGGTLNSGVIKAGKNSLLDITVSGDTSISNNGRTKCEIAVTGRFCLTDENGRLSQAVAEDTIFFNSNGIPKEKRYRGKDDAKVEVNLWEIPKGTNEDGLSELMELIPDQDAFSYPKPKALIKRVLTSINKKHATILDFFAGSGTTGSATWELNAEDGGERKFILVTNNESNICEDITYERLLRCNLPEHGNYQQGLEYLQLKHVAETEVDGYNMATSFEHIKQVVNVRFGSFSVIEETDDWYITDKIAVLKNYVKYPAFFEKYGKHAAYGLVTKKERQAQTFRSEASKRVSIDDIHVFNKEYLNDLYRVVREDMA